MKPDDKQLRALAGAIASAYTEKGLSNAELGRIARVHPSQVGRICTGEFKTFSHNVVQICKALGVKAPRAKPSLQADPVWARVQSSLRRVWDETPEGAMAIAQLLDAVYDLRVQNGSGSGPLSDNEE